MQVRKERVHQCGLSNLDFRSQKDVNSLKKYQDLDIRRTNFGTMGRLALKPKQRFALSHDEQFKRTIGREVDLPADPRFSPTKTLYAEFKKPLKQSARVSQKRFGNLEDARWTGKVFTGEDYTHQTWYANRAFGFPTSLLISKNQQEGRDEKAMLLKGDKLDKHAKAIQETQLVKVKNRDTLEGKVDLSKVKDIRRAIRRRYGNRTNYRKIFNQWDRHSKGRIDVDDVLFMVNKFGISINKNESRVLLASADHNQNGVLEMDEFINMIFNSDETLNVDLSRLPVQKEEPLLEYHGNENIMMSIQKDAHKLQKLKDQSQFKLMIQKKVRDVAKEFLSNDVEKTKEIDFPNFKRIILKRVQLPQYVIQNEGLFQKLFQEFDTQQKGTVNYPNFIESIKNFNCADKEVDYDLGPETLPILKNYSLVDNAVGPFKRPLLIEDCLKVPENKLELIQKHALKVNRYLQGQFKSKKELVDELKNGVKVDNLGNAHIEDIQEFFVNKCHDELIARKFTRKDIEGFLSSFVYNQFKMTNLEDIPNYVFMDDIGLDNRLHQVRRAMPPPESSKKDVANIQIPEQRMKDILRELEDKTFDGKVKMFQVFRKYDVDKDGYVSHQDIENCLKDFKMKLSEQEVGAVINLLDPQQKGFMDFNQFSNTVTPIMSKQLIPEDMEDEKMMFKRDICNTVPNRYTVQEKLKFHKTFTERMADLRTPFLPEKDMLLNLTPSTRFGATPEHQNTFIHYHPYTDSGMYLSEKQRFEKKGLNSNIDFQKSEKMQRDTFYEAKLQRIRDHQSVLTNRISENNLRNTVYDQQKIENKIKRYQFYEKNCHNPNL